MVMTWGGFSRDDSLDLGVASFMNLSKSPIMAVGTSNNMGKVENTFSILHGLCLKWTH